MNKRTLFIAAIALQFCVLTGMVVKAQLPLWTGTEIHLRTKPIDPRSLFRGNYARLRYDISTLPAKALLAQQDIRRGEKVYVSLQGNADGLYSATGVSLQRPAQGIYLAGRVASKTKATLRIRYGIEAWFAPREEALRLERELRQSARAVVKVDRWGRAALQAVLPGEAELPAE